MSTVKSRTPHRQKFTIARPYNGRFLIVCHTTTKKEAACWLAHFKRLRPAGKWEIWEPAKKQQRCKVCDDTTPELIKGCCSQSCLDCLESETQIRLGGCQDCEAKIFKGRTLCAECEHENSLNAAQYAMDQDLLERGKALI